MWKLKMQMNTSWKFCYANNLHTTLGCKLNFSLRKPTPSPIFSRPRNTQPPTT